MTTSSSRLSNAAAIMNTIAAWLVVIGVLFLRPESLVAIYGISLVVVLSTFAVERGFRHLDFKAGPDGVGAHIDDTPEAKP